MLESNHNRKRGLPSDSKFPIRRFTLRFEDIEPGDAPALELDVLTGNVTYKRASIVGQPAEFTYKLILIICASIFGIDDRGNI